MAGMLGPGELIELSRRDTLIHIGAFGKLKMFNFLIFTITYFLEVLTCLVFVLCSCGSLVLQRQPDKSVSILERMDPFQIAG